MLRQKLLMPLWASDTNRTPMPCADLASRAHRPSASRRQLHLAAALVLPILAAASPAVATADAASEQHACLRCHAMETIAYRDPQTWEIVDLSLDAHKLSHSVHGEMACTECHRRSYRRYPHPEQAERESFSCVGCHADDPVSATYDFNAIDAEYARSVHVAPGAKRAETFSCHSCHDPHAFNVSRVGQEIAEIVRDGNQVCISCHKRVQDPLSGSHDWLPKRDQHWSSVRCVACHTPVSDDASKRISHQILAAEDSNRACVSCHSKDASLLNSLYAYRSEEELARQGLFSKALFNDAYIIGMSRNPTLDRISLAILALTLLVLTGHGLLRYRAYRRRNG